MFADHPRPRSLPGCTCIDTHAKVFELRVHLLILPNTLNTFDRPLAECKDRSNLIGVRRMGLGNASTAALAPAACCCRMRNRGKVDIVNHIARNARRAEYNGYRNTIGALRDRKTADPRVCRADCPAAST